MRSLKTGKRADSWLLCGSRYLIHYMRFTGANIRSLPARLQHKPRAPGWYCTFKSVSICFGLWLGLHTYHLAGVPPIGMAVEHLLTRTCLVFFCLKN